MNNARLLPTPSEMIGHLDRLVIGQERAKQDLAVAVYNHYLSQAYRDRTGSDLGRHHILMIGPTGVGKTYLVRSLAEYLDVPVGFTSAAGLVEAGYKGNSVDSVVRSLLDRAGGDPRKAERGILFIDEVDKIRRGETGGRDVSGEGVQNALLTLLDGRRSRGMEGFDHAEVDTGKMLFVCTGAFVNLTQIVEDRLGTRKSRIGFGVRPKEQLAVEEHSIYRTLCQAQTADLVEFGMIPEFIGRFATLTVLHDLGRKELRQIIDQNVERSPLVLQQELARVHGIDLQFDDDALQVIADEAAELGTGARGLHRLLGAAVDSVDSRWHELAEDGVTSVKITVAAVLKQEGAEPILGRERTMLQRTDHQLRQEALEDVPRQPKPIAPGQPAHRDSPFTNTSGWTDERIWNQIEQLKSTDLDWEGVSPAARKWWLRFEEDSRERPSLVLRVVEELKVRSATIGQFYLANVYSRTDNIQANLFYLDYMRIKDADDKKLKELADQTNDSDIESEPESGPDDEESPDDNGAEDR